ncbi:VOC family protein [Congregibacter variabilis]|uniref:VOC family protein n=1 Tax=Congregibacter variabilis TaxID=3081200 RepID=A0ABZ0I6G9_9GAMM|nr:VOC family protein [Congregibacter sp. IMCC43200]
MQRLITLILGLVLAACSSITYNLPAVSSDTDGNRRTGKFIWHDLISDDPKGTETFYGALFGWEFRSLELLGANYWVISLDGTPIAGMVEQSGLAAQQDISQWMSVISVADAHAAVQVVTDAGGRVLREPVSIGDRGVIAVFTDAQGAHFATLTTPSGDPQDSESLPQEGAFLWHELWTSDVSQATKLYAKLGSLEAVAHSGERADGSEIDFRVLRSDKLTRAGIRSLPDPQMPSLWMPYLRVESIDRLKQLLLRIPEVGGQVLVPAMPRPAGGYVSVIAGPSGAPIALQTWGSDQPLIEDL